MASVQPGDPTSPILLRVQYECVDENAAQQAIHALTRAAAQQVAGGARQRAHVRVCAECDEQHEL
jgi:hypothetical protein